MNQFLVSTSPNKAHHASDDEHAQFLAADQHMHEDLVEPAPVDKDMHGDELGSRNEPSDN